MLSKNIVLGCALILSSLGVKNALNVENKEKLSSFEVIKGENYVLENDSIKTNAGGNYILKDTSNVGDDFHLRFKVNTNLYDVNKDYGVLLHGKYEDNKLTGDYFKPYFANNGWQLQYGTYTDGVYNEIFSYHLDFGNNFTGLFDIYVQDSTIAFRMDEWAIGSIDMVYKTGETYFVNTNATLDLSEVSITKLTKNIGNYTMRTQWGGYNRYGYTRCFNEGQTHTFNMTLPNEVNLETIDKLYLSRFAPYRMGGQLANVKINGISTNDFLNSSHNDNQGDHLYEIEKTLVTEKTLNFEIKAAETEYCVANYKLMYEIDGVKYYADSILMNSVVSETEHNFKFDAQGWNGSQYLFVNLENEQVTSYLGQKVNKPLMKIGGLGNAKALKVEEEFNADGTTVDFKKWNTIGSAYTYETLLTLNSPMLGTIDLDTDTYTFNEPCAGKYALTFKVKELDQSFGMEVYEKTIEGEFSIGGVILEDYPYTTVVIESNNNAVTYTDFVNIFNEETSRLFELGTFNKNATFEMKFFGPAISLWGYKGELGGEFEVYIDNNKMNSSSSFAEKEKYKALLGSYRNLGEGEHTLKIKTLEDKWYAFDYFKVDVPNEIYYQKENLAKVGKIITSSPTPTGGGNKDLNVIRNEKIYPIGSSGLGPSQYDSFVAPGLENEFYMGYEFEEEIEISKVCYQAGCTWNTGGWFRNNTLRLEVLIGGTWKEVKLNNELGYPNSDERKDFIECNIYYFLFDKVKTKGVRIIGEAGGSEHFVSVSQIEIYQNQETKSYCEGRTYKDKIY